MSHRGGKRSRFMTQFERKPMSKPGRVVLVFAFIGIFVFMGTMMKRTLDFKSRLHATADAQEFEAARIPLPAGPRRFQ
jgi:hypothetical protein